MGDARQPHRWVVNLLNPLVLGAADLILRTMEEGNIRLYLFVSSSMQCIYVHAMSGVPMFDVVMCNVEGDV